MADNLTVNSPGAGKAGGSEAATAGRADPAKHQLEQLREIAKKRTGRKLTDAQLQEIISRRKEKLEERSRLAETKTSFETAQGKEQVANHKDDLRARTER